MQNNQLLVLQTEKKPVDSALKQMICKKIVYVSGSQWIQKQMKDVCPLISEWKIDQLWVNHNQAPLIVKNISSIKFPNLKQIALHGNQISSIEGFSRIRMPSLQLLYLNNNHIIKVVDLKKGYWASLEVLNMNGNRVQDAPDVFKISSPPLKYLYIEEDESDLQQCSDLRGFSKARVKEDMSFLYVRSQNRIKQDKATDTLINKYHRVFTAYALDY